jgi:hypothetical protein
LNATYSRIHSEVVDVAVDVAANKEGDPADYVPNYAFTLGANYSFNWAEEVPGFARLDYSYRDKVHYTDRFIYQEQYAVQSSDSVSLLDGRIGAQWKNGMSTELYGTNLTNTNRSIDPFTNFSQAMRTRPRTVGVKVGYTF